MTADNEGQVDQTVADKISKTYEELVEARFDLHKIAPLETSQYLEQCLWPNFNDKTQNSKAHVMSIALLINEKFRERIDAWECITQKPDEFVHFFRKVLEFALDDEVSMLEQTALITFLINCFNSVEVDVVRQQFMPLINFPIWGCLLKSQREGLFIKNPKLKKYWNKTEAKVQQMSADEREAFEFNRTFLWNLIAKFKRVLADIDDENKEIDLSCVLYCERFIALMIDLESLLATRRFFNALLQASHLITYCTLSNLITEEVGSLFCQLVTMLKTYARFEIDDISGQPLTSTEMAEQHYSHIADLQKAAFKHFRTSMKDFHLLNVASVDTRRALLGVFQDMKQSDIYKFGEYLRLVPREGDESDTQQFDKKHLVEMIIFHCERRVNQLQQLNEMPLYPTEKVIWDEGVVPYDRYKGDTVLALNKLNLQFLTLHDYLMRNFNLFQMESTYEIRQDIEDAVFRMKPWKHETEPKEIVWGGWARMALRVAAIQITKVGNPLLGEKSPSEVLANVSIQLPRRPDLRREWEQLRRHDVCFLVSCEAIKAFGTPFDVRKPFKNQINVTAIRGCEIEGMLDPSGRLIEEFASGEGPSFDSEMRTYRVKLDTNQYRLDMERQLETGAEDVYYTFNLIVRRDPKSNNFKAVLSTIRQLLNTECVVPDWLHELILGHGEPDAAHYTQMSNAQAQLNFNDTFIDYEHLREAFPDQKIVASVEEKEMLQPFRLTFKDLEPQHDKAPEERETGIHVKPYTIPKRGPYADNEPKKNAIRFTPVQIEAIKSGMQPGLTVVVGPPGTGKTDVAVQIISNIYHNWPEQRTLIVTHSNQALNQLFEKIMALDVDERHLLRLGHGEEALETEKDFSRYGRVNYVLQKRLELLKKVETLKDSLGIEGDVGYSCETAGHFFRFNVCRAWDTFLAEVAQKDTEKTTELLAEKFPFTKFFDDVTNLFNGETFEDNLEIARSCWRYISDIFTQLEEFRAFEMLRNGKDRTEYLLVKEAKIIAMTCTLAALKRKDLVELGFRYDNILMEEAGQILEVETFIPLLLQNPKDGQSRLKRWIMIGDHHQLPPVVQNVACQKYSNLEQSLFARFVRLGVKKVQLDKQGRARSEIADLYNWRYKDLGNLPHVQALPEFNTCNPGFVYPYQFIDVPDFQGVGESSPSPYFYQNLGEAEYAVALFTYMRILGYPAEKISIITTYNGQASLLRDVIKRRCADNPLIGTPQKISTVDKYQGQQNDYVILSLVRTQHIGHIRDVRRLVVALSRARLGLFVLGRLSLYEKCHELKEAFEKLKKNPTKLHIVPYEGYPSERKAGDQLPGEAIVMENTAHIAAFVHEFYSSNVAQLQAAYEEQMREHYERMRALEEEAEAMQIEEAEEKGTVEVKPVAKKKEDGEAILFEEMDFEKLEEVPKL
ncbi:hypothetical protein QR680_004283 [Steinernema hermaphroditum]|uniref:Intron-binding protein aquarius n=1 Tax=Steinernema hermaphroditum TaxID=289476 RepID=A0AA39LTR6_9BILA|nr:hypothetical protein QR680_004283 [Steinernema hermaphroditum]